jgi:hypothetical protein
MSLPMLVVDKNVEVSAREQNVRESQSEDK